MKRSSSLTTQTAVFEGESIKLAGYLRDIEENAGWGIPFLRDIPVIGWLFGGRSTRKETVQRIFVVTPHIVDLDQEMLYRLQATRLRDVSIGEDVQKDTEEEEAEKEARKRAEAEAAAEEPEEAAAEVAGEFAAAEAPKEEPDLARELDALGEEPPISLEPEVPLLPDRPERPETPDVEEVPET